MTALRHKGFHIVNLQPTFQFLAKIVLNHMPEKLRKRVHFYSNFTEMRLFDIEDFPVACGGSKSNQEFIGKSQQATHLSSFCAVFYVLEPLKQSLESKKEFFLSYSSMKVNLKLYSKKVVNCEVGALSRKL